ncbi:F0F1 ATP synthase subunit epsilon [Neotabrizicola shimadae]|uniref:ATP synthase epsilon chain n=1 Tax=Neotabrizicola shimadae TaxID=2807096 RepID=A0A8G0ZNH1_9RHOB|nr:F0F1 ATP synthase subunit epsilon [Neotabrizicola shimadae]QYZ68596.1 F0F1 ATP synthase subunit epsilon [Neotabrizicola shimadae]
MADTLQFDLVSPERKLASVQAREVRIPGADGDLTAMPGHAPLITTLRPGILTVVSSEGTQEFAVTSGFAQIDANGVTVLAERGMPKEELTRFIHQELVDQARAAAAAAHPDAVDSAAKLLADMEALGSHMLG